MGNIVKSLGGVRIWGDFTVTVNQAINVHIVDKYPFPRIQDIFTTLSNGKKYTPGIASDRVWWQN